MIVFGPGSLYTSIIPNLLPVGMKEAIRDSEGVKVFVSNIMTQIGETVDYSVSDHVDAIEKHLGINIIDAVILNNKDISKKISLRYADRGVIPVPVDEESLRERNIEIITHENLCEINEDGVVRHDNEVLAQVLYNIVLEVTSTIEYKKN